MKRTTVQSILAVVVLLLMLSGCRGGSEQAKSGSQTTGTVAPAAAQPSPTGTDAMTQTVEMGDNRSEEDGGTTTEGSTSTATAPPAVAPAATHAKRPVKKK